MGISPFSHWASSCGSCKTKTCPPVPPAAPAERVVSRPLPNPNPRNFAIEDVEVFGDYLLVRIRYPDCTNYEGTKMMLFRGVSLDELHNAKELDPHFAEDGIVPVARFVPTPEGWQMGQILARAKAGL